MRSRELSYMRKLSAESSDAIGRVSEELLLIAVQRAGLGFPWFLFARPALADEDSRGIDIVVFARGDKKIFLQSKSSRGKAISFQSKKRRDAIIVVVVSLDEDRNFRAVSCAMERAYAEAIGLRGIDIDAQDRSGA